MHVELAVPALLPTHEALQAAFDKLRLATLELVVARGRITRRSAESFETWLGRAFGLEGGALPAGALTVIADQGVAAAGDAHWMRADPVHLHLARDHLVLVPSAAFALAPDEAGALCETLNAHFTGVLAITPSADRPGCWCARLEGDAPPSNVPPLDAAGDDVDAHLRAQAATANPAQSPARTTRAHALLNELQMLLHAHPVNAAREARGEPVVNSVWFWGAGPAPRQVQGPWRAVLADEPLARGLARIAAIQCGPLAASGDRWLESRGETSRALVILDALRALHALHEVEAYVAGLQALEVRWLAPLLEALRTQRIGMLTLHVPDAAESLSIELVRSDLRRFWRRPRALAPWKE